MAKYPVFADGATLSASLFRDAQPDIIIKSAQQNSDDTTTLANDNELFTPLKANAQYFVKLHLVHSSNTAEDIKIGWSLPTSATAQWGVQGAAEGVTSNTAATEMKLETKTDESASNFGGGNQVATTAYIQGEVTTGSSAGTLQFRFAKRVTGSGTTAVRAGSTLIVRRIA